MLGPQPRKGNVVVRLRGTGSAKPVLFIGHLDVVEALRSDWSVDPFKLIEESGFFYGRGTQDTKNNDAMMVAAFLRMKQENFRPSRDPYQTLSKEPWGKCSHMSRRVPQDEWEVVAERERKNVWNRPIAVQSSQNHQKMEQNASMGFQARPRCVTRGRATPAPSPIRGAPFAKRFPKLPPSRRR